MTRLERCYDFLDWLGKGCDILLAMLIWAGLAALSWFVVWVIYSCSVSILGA